jgi:hypothetical protein
MEQQVHRVKILPLSFSIRQGLIRVASTKKKKNVFSCATFFYMKNVTLGKLLNLHHRHHRRMIE